MKKNQKPGFVWNLADAQAHAARHGFAPPTVVGAPVAEKAPDAVQGLTEPKLPKPVKMTRPEREYNMILEAMKRRGDISDFKYQGLSLAWGEDPKTGILMRYKCDFVMFGRDGDVTIIEVKGPHIFEKDIIRFKGCRSEWPQFQFELHQLIRGQWNRVL